MFVEWMFVFVLPCHCRTFRGFLCASSRGVCARVAEALRVAALAHVSRMLSEHRMLDSCVAPVPLSSVASLKFETAHAVLAEGDVFQICQRLVRS